MVRPKKATRTNPSKPARPTVNLCRFIMVRGHGLPSPSFPNLGVANLQSTINRAHQEGAITYIRVDSLRLSGRSNYVGAMASSSSVRYSSPLGITSSELQEQQIQASLA